MCCVPARPFKQSKWSSKQNLTLGRADETQYSDNLPMCSLHRVLQQHFKCKFGPPVKANQGKTHFLIPNSVARQLYDFAAMRKV